MSTINKNEKRGRPKKDSESLSRAKIIEMSKVILSNEKKGLSIRNLALHLKVDPMAIYHYFKNKDALLEAVCMSYLSRIYRPKISNNWELEIKKLVISYIEILRDTPLLIDTLVSMGSKSQGPATLFEEQFIIATSNCLTKTQLQSAIHFLADFMHGFSLGFKYLLPKEREDYQKGLKGSLNLYMLALSALIEK